MIKNEWGILQFWSLKECLKSIFQPVGWAFPIDQQLHRICDLVYQSFEVKTESKCQSAIAASFFTIKCVKKNLNLSPSLTLNLNFNRNLN
ncbi:MAG: hypothetical protein EA001_10895 [Oscillatoriales cyanobacterium]|nr:MAG: hypothetical protein EA001_10895 [Oscillatoriales cyanobacterium]